MLFSSSYIIDGRIKPDVCNVGTLSSAKSILEDECGNNCNNHEGVEIMSGTSMAAPSTTAAATILYQYLRDGYYSCILLNNLLTRFCAYKSITY